MSKVEKWKKFLELTREIEDKADREYPGGFSALVRDSVNVQTARLACTLKQMKINPIQEEES